MVVAVGLGGSAPKGEWKLKGKNVSFGEKHILCVCVWGGGVLDRRESKRKEALQSAP